MCKHHGRFGSRTPKDVGLMPLVKRGERQVDEAAEKMQELRKKNW